MALERREELEARLRERIERARADYQRAKDAAEKARLELKTGDIPEPDGSQAYRNALVAERLAFQAHRKALREFTALILGGTTPNEDASD